VKNNIILFDELKELNVFGIMLPLFRLVSIACCDGNIANAGIEPWINNFVLVAWQGTLVSYFMSLVILRGSKPSFNQAEVMALLLLDYLPTVLDFRKKALTSGCNLSSLIKMWFVFLVMGTEPLILY